MAKQKQNVTSCGAEVGVVSVVRHGSTILIGIFRKNNRKTRKKVGLKVGKIYTQNILIGAIDVTAFGGVIFRRPLSKRCSYIATGLTGTMTSLFPDAAMPSWEFQGCVAFVAEAFPFCGNNHANRCITGHPPNQW